MRPALVSLGFRDAFPPACLPYQAPHKHCTKEQSRLLSHLPLFTQKPNHPQRCWRVGGRVVYARLALTLKPILVGSGVLRVHSEDTARAVHQGGQLIPGVLRLPPRRVEQAKSARRVCKRRIGRATRDTRHTTHDTRGRGAAMGAGRGQGGVEEDEKAQ